MAGTKRTRDDDDDTASSPSPRPAAMNAGRAGLVEQIRGVSDRIRDGVGLLRRLNAKLAEGARDSNVKAAENGGLNSDECERYDTATVFGYRVYLWLYRVRRPSDDAGAASADEWHAHLIAAPLDDAPLDEGRRPRRRALLHTVAWDAKWEAVARSGANSTIDTLGMDRVRVPTPGPSLLEKLLLNWLQTHAPLAAVASGRAPPE